MLFLERRRRIRRWHIHRSLVAELQANQKYMVKRMLKDLKDAAKQIEDACIGTPITRDLERSNVETC